MSEDALENAKKDPIGTMKKRNAKARLHCKCLITCLLDKQVLSWLIC